MKSLRDLKLPQPWWTKKREEPDGEFIERLRAQDAPACAELVERYYRPVYHMAYRLSRNREDAEDIAQEVFFRALRSLHSLHSTSTVKTWLFRIAVNLYIDQWRKARQSLPLLAAGVENRGPLACLEEKERHTRLEAAILQLKDKQRVTLVLRISHGFSFQEIAETMGSPLGTVKANYHCAVVRLRSLLGTPESSTSH